MSLQSAILYLRNALIEIETQKSNEVNYGVYIKFLLRQQCLNAQQASAENRTAPLSGPLAYFPPT